MQYIFLFPLQRSKLHALVLKHTLLKLPSRKAFTQGSDVYRPLSLLRIYPRVFYCVSRRTSAVWKLLYWTSVLMSGFCRSCRFTIFSISLQWFLFLYARVHGDSWIWSKSQLQFCLGWISCAYWLVFKWTIWALKTMYFIYWFYPFLCNTTKKFRN